MSPDAGPLSFGPDIAADLEPALRREWLVTNGVGGYAMGTVAGIPTRVYHGLLTASLRPPVDRRVMVAGLVEWATVAGRRVALHALEYADGTIDQRGFEHLAGFRLEGAGPAWTVALGDVRLEKRVWMAHGSNTTYVRWSLAPGSAAREVALEITPLGTWRDHHATAVAFEPRPEPAVTAGTRDGIEVAVRFPGAPRALRMRWDGDTVEPGATWFRGLHHRAETERGLPDRTDALAVATLRGTVGPGQSLTLVLTAEDEDPDPPDVALAAAVARETELLVRAGRPPDPATRILVVAADAFLVDRWISGPGGGTTVGRTILAGYPWFSDWGRDTMIALPGLCLSTGRHDDAARILRSFAGYVVDGLLPNNFADAAGEEPGRNTVDASLWYPLAIAAYEDATGERSLADELLPVLCDILDHHLAGTRYGIRADADGLLRAGEPGQQLTWMDARVGDVEITPRIGKPVEIQALWINALEAVAGWCARAGYRRGTVYANTAARARDAFAARFWRPDLGYLLDVVDGPDGDDPSLRPNQLLALGLRSPLVSASVAEAVLDAVGRELETPVGLRSLAPSDERFVGCYTGGPASRDGVYHQGTAWTWLAGPYVDALLRFGGADGVARARVVVDGLHRHLLDAGLGSVSEIAEGDAPFVPKGCPWQAWSVGEALRATLAVARVTSS